MSEHIHTPEDTRIFVFGSNRLGIHKRGAAKYALDKLGAVLGEGEGITGKCYALPTKSTPQKSLTLTEVREHVAKFLAYAKDHPNTRFFVSRVGCGLAGFKDEDIAPMFMGSPENCDLPPDWKL